jgi:hypothetical protein
MDNTFRGKDNLLVVKDTLWNEDLSPYPVGSQSLCLVLPICKVVLESPVLLADFALSLLKRPHQGTTDLVTWKIGRRICDAGHTCQGERTPPPHSSTPPGSKEPPQATSHGAEAVSTGGGQAAVLTEALAFPQHYFFHTCSVHLGLGLLDQADFLS